MYNNNNVPFTAFANFNLDRCQVKLSPESSSMQ